MANPVEELFSFGIWVRRRRKALDLTQAALAQRVGCAEVSIRKLEADAFRPSREIADRLASCLEIPPDDREVFVQIARAARTVDCLPAPLMAIDIDHHIVRESPIQDGRGAEERMNDPATMPLVLNGFTPPHNLPAQTTPLIGREREMTTGCSLLQEPGVRLLTLTGPGGIGKTRLSLAVGLEVAPYFRDGVFFVPLAGITDALRVPSLIAQVLGVQENAETLLVEGIKRYVCGKHMLLILDNFEHVLAARTIVSELLRAAPELKVLITSRAVLHVYGERHLPVPPLAYPDSAVFCSPELLLQCEAIQLFIDRVRAVKPDYPFSDATISTVAQICQRLEGLPLAIELAAARIRLFPPAGILSRLEQALPFLRGGAVDQDARHQTLENTIAWSYQLLEPSERTLFRRMAVFVGGCTLEAAIAVCDLDDMSDLVLWDSVQALLDKSLLKETITVGGEPRFSMLELIREFALTQLTLSGELDMVRQRHAAYYHALVESAEPKLVGKESIAWLDQLDAEYGNLRATLAWCKAKPQRVMVGVQVAGALFAFWDLRGQFTEGRDWLDSLLAYNVRLPAAVRAKALDGAGVLARNQGDYAQATVLHQESLALWTELGNQLGIARSHVYLGVVAYSRGDFLKAKCHLDLVLAIFADTEPATEEAGEVFTQTLSALGVVFRGYSDFDRARVYFERALALSQKLANQRNEAHILSNLGGMKNSLRQHRAAQIYLKQSLELRRALQDYSGQAVTLYNLAVAEQATYQYGDAQEHFLAALKMHETTGDRRQQIHVKLGLGILYHQIGDFTAAYTWLQRALALSHEIEYETGRAFALANLGPVLRDMGDFKQAEQVLHQGLRLAQAQHDKGTESYCLSSLGTVALEVDQASDAVDVALRALTLRREIGMVAWTTTDIATLAAAYLALNQGDQALAYADEAVRLLTEGGTDEPEFPQRDYFRCYQVYAALGRGDQARSTLQSAYTIVLTHAAKIGDGALRQSFLTHVPINHTVAQEAERYRYPMTRTA